MIRLTLAGAALFGALAAVPAFAQIDKGCYNYSGQNVWTAKSAEKLRADIECFKKAKGLADVSIANREKRIAQLVPTAPPVVINPIVLDPIDPAQITPIADNFDPYAEGLLYKGPVARDATEGEGAFRFTCTPTSYNYDDSIIAPGKIGGSMHGHENFGNTEGNAKSNYLSLRTAGESSCHNKINRSHYWQPWMQNGAGQILRAKLITLYYKATTKADPKCSVKGKACVDLPNGFRAISGYDPARLGQSQPENTGGTWWRCNANLGSDQIGNQRRATIAEAVTDCKVDKYGTVQIISTVVFGDCWNGLLDSPDHRSHLARASFGSWGYEKCPATHPFIIPTLTQQVTYEILRGDTGLRLSCDVMNGVSVPGGVCVHADYREAWSPKFLQRIHDVCLRQLKDCSFGSFGDGEYMTLQPDRNKDLPRLIPAPARTVPIPEAH